MNDLARTAASGGPVTLPPLAPSPALRAAMLGCNHLHGPNKDVDISRVVLEEAKGLLPLAEARARPASVSELQAWLAPVNAAVRNPQSQRDFLARVAVITAALSNVPAAVFTRDMQAEAIRQWQFWPSGAEVYELVRDAAHRQATERRQLGQVAAHVNPPRSTPREPIDPATVAAFRYDAARSIRNRDIVARQSRALATRADRAMREGDTRLAAVFGAARDDRDPAVAALRAEIAVPDDVCTADYLDAKGFTVAEQVPA